MNRALMLLLTSFGALTPLVLDSAVKGAVLVSVAAVTALGLWRASAAARHLVWLASVVALLAVPVLSVALPQWRILPGWAAIPDAVAEADPIRTPRPEVTPSGPSEPTTAGGSGPVPGPGALPAPELRHPDALRTSPAQVSVDPSVPAASSVPAVGPWLAWVWAAGVMLLAVRLVAAHFFLRRAGRRCTAVALSPAPGGAGCATREQAVAAAVSATCAHLGIRQGVRLLIDDQRSIPVVWGVLRPHLRLPAEAFGWSDGQLRSVLLHELAHVRRWDTLVQWLAQISCALHWWNPLVWLAAWRLHVERERACDDFVLASGVRPSAYAAHLLEIATKLPPAKWVSACALAMARRSSLEGRLVAVLSRKPNRGGVTRALAAVTLLLGAGIAIPLAMLRAADERPAKQPTPVTTDLKPKHEYARSLFRRWGERARTDGRIPGALIGHLAREVDGFLKQHPDDEKSPPLATLRPRLDASRDWDQTEVVALLDDITAVSTAPVSWADIPMEFAAMQMVQGGQPLPVELESAAWGEPAANGLRAAWLLEPRAEQYPLGTVLKARVLFHNAGNAPVVFRTETWHQSDPHTARDARGLEIKVSGTWYSGETPLATFRLAPGEYCEVMGHGIAIGAGEYAEERSVGSVGAVIEAGEADQVSLRHTVDTTDGGWTRADDPKDPAELWKVTIARRVADEVPMPLSAADRGQLIRRVTRDLFGEPPTGEEVAAFVAADTPDALARLTARLQAKPRIDPFAGRLPTGETRFRVIAADPNAAKAPRTANAPGRYVLGDGAHLLVSQLAEGDRRTNKAVIAFLSPDPTVAPPGKPYEIALPDGLDSYGIVWDRGAGELWVMQRGLVRKYEFNNPAQVQEMRIEPGSIINIPEHLQEPLKEAFNVAGLPVQQQSPQKSGGAHLTPATERKLKWGEPVNGLRMALAWPPTLWEPGLGEAPEFWLVVQNVSQAGIRLIANDAAPNPRRLMMRDHGSPLSAISDPTPMPGDWLLRPREVAFLRLFQPGEKTADGRTTSAVIEQDIRAFPQYGMTAEMSIGEAPAGAWTGQLRTGETRGSVDVIPPAHKEAQALYKSWATAARKDGKIPGAVVGALAESVRMFIKNNPTWDTTPQLEQLLPRFDASHDWSGADAVALLDDLAALQDTPLSSALDRDRELTLISGAPLPAPLADAPWGEPLPNGLRAAYQLEPRASEHRLNTPLKGRILIHNAGKEPVVFRTRGWHQLSPTARDAKGRDIKVESTSWTTLGRLTPYRLAPGEFVELHTTGIGLGATRDDDGWQNIRVGSWLDVKVGDEVTVTTGPVPLNDWNEDEQLKLDGEPRWWFDHITARLSRHLPLPADADARSLIVYRVAMELFGTPVSGEINAAFVADREPSAIDSLAKRLLHRPGLHAWAGPLQPGQTTFRVLAADPDAARKPRIATDPGRYTLGPNIRLVVTRRPEGLRIVNDAHIELFPAEPSAPAPGKPHAVVLPDGYNTWAAGWEPGTAVLWVAQKESTQRYDFANPAQVRETHLESGDAGRVPPPIREALRRALDVPGPPVQQQEPLKPRDGAGANPPASPGR